jgi:hypothetical protein
MNKFDERIRQEYLCDVLNAAVNLYGVVEYGVVIEMCKCYAKGKTGPLATPPTAEEIDAMIGWDAKTGKDTTPVADSLGKECLFAGYSMGGKSVLVNVDIWDDCYGDDDFLDDEKASRAVNDFLRGLESNTFSIFGDEAYLLGYADIDYYEHTPETARLAAYLHDEYDIAEKDAEEIVGDIVHEMRRNPDPNHALCFTQAQTGIVIENADDYDDLMDILLQLSRNVRAWRYGGRTDAEMIADGISDKFHAQIDRTCRRNYLRRVAGKTVREFLDDEIGSVDADDYMDVDEPEPLSDDELEKALPSPDYPQHPVDFKFVKDAKRREAVLRDYRLSRRPRRGSASSAAI